MGTRTSDHEYRKRRAYALERATICYLCQNKIDKTLKRPHPMAPEADHVEAYAETGNNLSELRIVHATCNRRKGAKTLEQAGLAIKKTSGLWDEMLNG